MDIQFMKDYYDLRYEETDGENHFVEETVLIRKNSLSSRRWKIYQRVCL